MTARSACRFCRIASALALLVCSPTVFAAPTYLISQQVYDAIDKSGAHIEKGEYAEAERILNGAHKRKGQELNAYEKAVISQQLAAIDFEREDYQSARLRFEKFLREDGLPRPFLSQLRFNLAQTYMLLERDADAVALLRPLFEGDAPPPAAFFLAAVALRNIGDTEEALRRAERGLALVAVPDETHYATALSLYLALEDYRNAGQILEQLLRRYPDKAMYWRQAAQVAIRLDDRARALTLGDMGYHRGALREEEDVLYLVKLYLDQGVPHRAARLLSKALADGVVAETGDNWYLLSLAWSDAREFDRAIEPLRKAAELSDHGRFYSRLGRLYMEQRRWDDARQMFAYALDKGALKQAHKTRLLKGIALVELGRIEEAEQEFTYCLSHPDTYEEAAGWLTFLGAASR